MVESLDMIIKLSNDITKEEGIDIPPRLTWMDGLVGLKSAVVVEKEHFGLKLLFLLMCTPWEDKELKYLDYFINGPDFSMDKVSSMSVQEIASKFQKMGMHNKNAYFLQQAFKKSSMCGMAESHLILPDVLRRCDDIQMKIALLVIQYVYGVVKVSYDCELTCLQCNYFSLL